MNGFFGSSFSVPIQVSCFFIIITLKNQSYNNAKNRINNQKQQTLDYPGGNDRKRAIQKQLNTCKNLSLGNLSHENIQYAPIALHCRHIHEVRERPEQSKMRAVIVCVSMHIGNLHDYL